MWSGEGLEGVGGGVQIISETTPGVMRLGELETAENRTAKSFRPILHNLKSALIGYFMLQGKYCTIIISLFPPPPPHTHTLPTDKHKTVYKFTINPVFHTLMDIHPLLLRTIYPSPPVFGFCFFFLPELMRTIYPSPPVFGFYCLN